MNLRKEIRRTIREQKKFDVKVQKIFNQRQLKTRIESIKRSLTEVIEALQYESDEVQEESGDDSYIEGIKEFKKALASIKSGETQLYMIYRLGYEHIDEE